MKGQGLTFPIPALKEAAVPVAALYGPNASGKSNLIDAIDDMQRAIVRSHVGSEAAEPIPCQPFLLDDESRKEPTRYSLFLSAAAQNNHPQLTELHRYFRSRWTTVLQPEVNFDPALAEHLSDYNHMEKLKALLGHADLGITDIHVRDVNFDDDDLTLVRDLANLMTKHLGRLEDVDGMRNAALNRLSSMKQLRFMHSGVDGTPRAFAYDLESKGTRTLLSLLIPALEALSAGSLLVIDELDTSLHPNLARAFISLFNKKDSNPHGAQLIFSTHDVALLDGRSMRQDEIWMTDKDDEGVSRFTPLTDFRLRSRDNIEKAYRNGRFGGVPTGGDFGVEFDDRSMPWRS